MPRDLPRGADSADDGSADPRLLAALESQDAARIAAALVEARLIVGVVALAGAEHASEGDMALALLQSRTGAQAMPAFTSLAALSRWRDDARPVPRPASELAAVVLGEGYDAMVVDVAGPAPWTLRGSDLTVLAAGYVLAGETLAARRSDPRLLAPTWVAAPDLLRACAGVEVYALDLELPDRGVRAPALGLVPPAGEPPVPVAERLLRAAGATPGGGSLDLLLLDGTRLDEARRIGRRLSP
jgi:hypothetical protein